jgi:beta-lysine 5,6-aminomutase alpha subunit
VWTNQGIQLLGMMTEAMHTPHMGDRYLALENARYVMNNARLLGEEVEFKRDGMIQRRAQTVLADATALLERVQREGLFDVLSEGVFADVYRPVNKGKGLDGVAQRSADYYNPVELELRRGLGLP